MSKRRSVAIVSSSPKIAANSPTFPPQNQRPDADTNWNLCFICQRQTKEKLLSAKDAVIIGNHINLL